MKVGTLEVELLANLARLRKDMGEAKAIVGDAANNIEKTVNAAKSALQALGIGLSAKLFVDMVKGSIDAMDKIRDLSKTTKIAVEDLAGLNLAAKQSGSDLGSIAASVNKLAVNMGKDADKFRQLGITAKDPLKAFMQLADIFKAIEDPQLRAAFGAATLGKKWEGAAPLLAEGSAKMAEMIQRGRELSGITAENADRADEFNDKLEELKAAAEGAKHRMAGDLLPALTNITTAMIKAHEEGGKLMALWVGLGGVGAALFTDMNLTPVQKLEKEIGELLKEYNRVKEVMSEGKSPLEYIFGDQTDNLSTRANAISIQMSELRVQRTALIAAAKQAADEQKAATAAAAAGDTKAAAAASARAKAFLDGGKAANVYQHELNSLEKQMATLKGQGELSAYMLKLQEENFKGVTAAQKEFLIGKMAAIIAEKQLIEVRREQIQTNAGLMMAEQALMDLTLDYTIAVRESGNQLAFENSLIGKSAGAIAQLSEARRIDLELMQALANVPDDDHTGTAAKLKKVAEAAKARHKILLLEGDLLRDQQDRWNNLANAAGAYFGKAGASAGKLIETMLQLGKIQDEIARKRDVASGMDDPVKREEELLKISKESTQQRLGAYGDMAQAAAGFFGEQSKGYKTLMAVSQVFHAAELAMTLAELVPKAIAAVLNQGNGDPYTAFGRMAAMAAVVTGLGVMIGGGGSAGAAPSAKDRQQAAGTGSVLGDSGAKSASIMHALDLLAKTSVIGNEHTAAMLASLRSIENNIGGLASLVVRTSGLLGGKGDLAGLNLGPQSKGFLGLGKSGNSLTDQGILIAAQTVGQARQGFMGSQYSDVTTSGRTWYGKSYSNTNRVAGALNADLGTQFSKIIDGLANSILQAAKVMGGDEDSITALLNNFNIAALDISLKDLKGSEIEEQLQAIFGKLGDDMAAAVLPGLATFQHVGEGLFETLVRLAQEFAATDAIAVILGKDVATAFGAVGMASIAARNDLVQLFGGIGELSDAVGKFYELYYSEGERLSRSIETIRGQFDALDVAMPGTVQAFRQLVEAQDLSTEAGRSMFATLVQLAPAFHSVQNAVASMIGSIQDSITSIYGGEFGTMFAKGALDAAVRALNAFVGLPGSYDAQTIADLIAGTNTQYIIDLVNAPGTDPVLISLLQSVLSAFGGWQSALNANTGATNTNTGGVVDNTAAQIAARMADARNGVADYLRGSLLSDESPLTVRQKYLEAGAQYRRLRDLAPNDVEAMMGVGSARDTWLKYSRMVNGSNGNFNNDYFSSFDEVNALGGGTVTRPVMAVDIQQQTAAQQAIAQEQATAQAGTTQAVAALAMTMIELAKDGDPVVRKRLQEQVDVLNKIANKNGAYSGGF